MARLAFRAAVGSSKDGQGVKSIIGVHTATDPSVGLTTAASDIATAVAIGSGDASVPVLATQVDITAASTDVAADILVTIDLSKVTSVSILKAAFAEIAARALGSGLTP